MMSPLIDAHCHLHDDRLWSTTSLPNCERLQGVICRARTAYLSHIVSCATHEQDWRVLQQLMEQQKDKSLRIVPAFGVHPWWVYGDDLTTLREMLTLYPTALVGEIGLCQSGRGRQIPLTLQISAFLAQLKLAVEFKRPCVLHCVGYYSKLLEILRNVDHLPPVLVLHSFSGSPDMMRSFLTVQGTKVYISLNAKQLTDPRMKKAAACCKEVPLEALLLETDAPDQAPSVEFVQHMFNQDDKDLLMLQEGCTGLNEPAIVKFALKSAAMIRSEAIEDLAAAVYQNCQAAFSLDDLDAN
ncbi:hypothetical protein PsorP6_008932 [Peronosclerospora sorghi]|uniref:Uncharacterized protein n=1 Tax=Peronosclerospora sorghi TaxID=230839 RepID=A0ACC0VZF7_9STRA|nr:hypothetical protein PsorP6_008932 [Peronosclerospora sorghi]